MGWHLTLLFADSYISPSTFRAYATRFSIRRSFSAAGSGVGNMAWTLRGKKKKLNKCMQVIRMFPDQHLPQWFEHKAASKSTDRLQLLLLLPGAVDVVDLKGLSSCRWFEHGMRNLQNNTPQTSKCSSIFWASTFPSHASRQNSLLGPLVLQVRLPSATPLPPIHLWGSRSHNRRLL